MIAGAAYGFGCHLKIVCGKDSLARSLAYRPLLQSERELSLCWWGRRLHTLTVMAWEVSSGVAKLVERERLDMELDIGGGMPAGGARKCA